MKPIYLLLLDRGWLDAIKLSVLRKSQTFELCQVNVEFLEPQKSFTSLLLIRKVLVIIYEVYGTRAPVPTAIDGALAFWGVS